MLYSLQWGSEYKTSLVTVKSCLIANGLVFKYHLKTGLNLVQYSEHHLNTGH